MANSWDKPEKNPFDKLQPGQMYDGNGRIVQDPNYGITNKSAEIRRLFLQGLETTANEIAGMSSEAKASLAAAWVTYALATNPVTGPLLLPFQVAKFLFGAIFPEPVRFPDNEEKAPVLLSDPELVGWFIEEEDLRRHYTELEAKEDDGGVIDDHDKQQLVLLQSALLAVRRKIRARQCHQTLDESRPQFSNSFVPVGVEADFDGELGIVKFSEPQGTLLDVDIAAIEQGVLVPSKVFVMFATERKVDLAWDQPQLPNRENENRFQAYFARGESGDVTRVVNIDPELYPLPIPRNDLRLELYIDGTSNVEILEAEAFDVATSKLNVPSEVSGEIITCYVVVPHLCNGLVQSVVWACDGMSFYTEINASTQRNVRMSPTVSRRFGLKGMIGWAHSDPRIRRVLISEIQGRFPKLRPPRWGIGRTRSELNDA